MRRLMLSMLALPVVVGGIGARQAGVTPQNPSRPVNQSATSPATGWLGFALSCDGCDGAAGSGPLVVRAVSPDGPAARLLQPGDTITAVNRTITDPLRMRDLLSATPVDSTLEFTMHGARGRYTVRLRKQRARYRPVAGDSLPVKYEGRLAGVGVEVLTPGAPIISRDSSGAMLIRVGEHVVRLTPPATNAR